MAFLYGEGPKPVAVIITGAIFYPIFDSHSCGTGSPLVARPFDVFYLFMLKNKAHHLSFLFN